MTDQRHQDLERALALRDKAMAKVQTLKGRYEAALEREAAIRKECQERGVQPEQLGEAIAQLEARFDRELASFKESLEETTALLATFEE